MKFTIELIIAVFSCTVRDAGGATMKLDAECSAVYTLNDNQEWVQIAEYRGKTTYHLNNLAPDSIIELCQAEDFAVVKYDLKTGELGIARRDDGSIKTFFRPNDVSYVLRKVNAGLWGEPDIIDGFEAQITASDFADDAQKFYSYERLEALFLDLPAQAHSVVLSFADNGQSSPSEVFSLLARLGEYRFVGFELQRMILTEAQEEAVFALRKKISVAVASFEALERYRAEEFTETIEKGLDAAITRQEELWHQATQLIVNADQFENSLNERQSLSYAMLELKILQIQGRMSSLDLTICESVVEMRLCKSTTYEVDFNKSDKCDPASLLFSTRKIFNYWFASIYQQGLKKSDIYFRNLIHQLLDRFASKDAEGIYSKIVFGEK